MKNYERLSRAHLIERLRSLEERGGARIGEVGAEVDHEGSRIWSADAEDAFWMRQQRDDRFLYINSACGAMFGVSLAELYAAPRRLLNAFHPDDAERVASFAFDGDAEPEAELECRLRPDASGVGRIRLRRFTVCDAGGVACNAYIAREVTTPHEDVSRFQTVIQASMDGFWVIDGEERLVDCNEALCAMLGQRREALLGASIGEFLLIEEKTPGVHRLSAIADRSKGRFAAKLRCKGGRILAIEVSASRLPGGDADALCGFFRDISSQREAQLALRDSERRYHSLFANLSQGVVYFDAGGAPISANAAAARILGLSMGQLLGRELQDPRWRMVHPDGRPFLREDLPAMVSLRTGKAVVGVEIGFYHPLQDQYRWILVDAFPQLRGGESKPFQVFAIFSDVTELREKEERLRLALLAGHAGVWEWDISSGALSWSEEMYRLYGVDLDRTEVTYDDWASRVHPDDLKRNAAITSAVFANRIDEYRIEFRVSPHPGTERWILAVGRLRRGSNGAARRLLGINVDITERKRIEDALRSSEQRYRTLVQATSAVTWSCPPSGLHDTPQPAWMAFTGQTAEESMGDGWTSVIHPDDVATASSRWNSAVKCQEPFSNEHRVRRYDGSWRWMSVYAAPVFDTHGRVVEWMGMGLDITEQKEIEKHLREARTFKQAILDAVDTQVAVLDRFGNIIEVNEAWRRSARENGSGEAFFPGTGSGANYLDICRSAKGPESDAAREAEWGIQAVIDRRLPIYTQDYSCHTPQVTRWFQMTVTPLGREEGGVVVSHSDISAPRLLAEGVRRSEARIRSLLRAAPVGIGFTVDRVFHDVNEAMATLTGYEGKQLLGQPVRMIYASEEECVRVGAETYQQLHEAGIGHVETRWQTRDGRILDISLTSAPIVPGDLSKGVAFAAMDITASKRAELERHAHEASQREALVGEVHHRIKNNLQGVIGLMRQYITSNAELQEPIAAAIGQVQTIAVVHGLQSRLGHSDIRLRDMLRAVADASASLAMAAVPPIDEDACVGNVWLAPGAAVNVALILNELIHNALKHGCSKEAHISLKEDGGVASVRITNPSDGRELDIEGIDLATGAGCGTGLGLVRTLMPRRGATLAISREARRVCAELVLSPPVTATPVPEPKIV